MKHTASVRSSGITACFLLLLAAGAFSASENRVTANQTICGDEDIGARVNAALRKGLFNLPAVPGAVATVSNGVVTVRGGVKSSADKRLIATIAIIAAQPCGIRNENVITDEITCPGDNRIRKSVRDMLAIALPCPVSSAITPTVSNGVVTLTGSVPAERYKEAAARAAEVTDCVQSVNNNLVVTPSSAFSGDCSALTDRQLKEVVVAAIRSKVSCGSGFNDGMVRVSNKVVTLRGSSVIDELIFGIAKSICPAINVINRMDHIGPECPPGARSCVTMDGEGYCCTGCKQCPPI